MSDGFKVLAIGMKGSRTANSFLRYGIVGKGTRLRITIPSLDAAAAGLKLGDTVQMQVGQGKHQGVFALGKGTTHCRALSRRHLKSPDLAVSIPLIGPLQKAFPGPAGRLRLIDADPKGVIAFAVDSK